MDSLANPCNPEQLGADRGVYAADDLNLGTDSSAAADDAESNLQENRFTAAVRPSASPSGKVLHCAACVKHVRHCQGRGMHRVCSLWPRPTLAMGSLAP